MSSSFSGKIGRTTGWKFRCSKCGRFIAHRDFSNDLVNVDFVPDTEFTVEKIEYEHKNCNNQKKMKNE